MPSLEDIGSSWEGGRWQPISEISKLNNPIGNSPCTQGGNLLFCQTAH